MFMKKAMKMTRLLTALLLLCALFACTACAALADEFKGYVASIGIVAADSAEAAKQQLESAGHTVLDMDLNEGTKQGKRIYMGYTRTMDPDKAISVLMLNFLDDDNPPATLNGYTLVGSAGEPNSAGGGVVNLNEGAGGAYIYLYVKRDLTRPLMTDIIVNRDITAPDGYTDPVLYQFDSNSHHLNLNAAGGSPIYMYCRDFLTSKTGVSLTAYYLSGSGAIQKSTVGKWLYDASETVSFSSQPTTVTYKGMSYAFAGWHDDENATGVPENTSDTAIAGMSDYGSTNYQKRYAAYRRDLKLSFDANGGTGAPDMIIKTQYLNLSEAKVRPQSVSFTIPDTTPTPPDSQSTFYRWCTSADGAGTTYAPGETITLTEDTTLYALWTVSAANCTVELSRYNYVDNGTERKPLVTVKHNGSVLSSQYYDVKYSNNKAPGTAKVTVTLKGQYIGTLTAYFHIADFKCDAQPWRVAPPKEDETAAVTLRGYLDGVKIPADDSRLRWEVVDDSINGATIIGNTLTIRSNVNTDEVLCRAIYDNESVGTVWVAIGILELPAFQLDTITANFDGMEHRPLIVDYVDVYGTPMVEGEGYTVKYLRDGVETTDFISAGNITVQVTGIDDYQGTESSGFTIGQAQMSSTQFVGFQKTFLYNGYPQKPEITLELPNGYRLKEGRDYTLSYTRDGAETDDFTSVGTIRVVAEAVKGGNFAGENSLFYGICSDDITNEISITTPENVTYDGQPHAASVQVFFQGETLAEGKDYTVTCKRNGKVTTDLAGAGTITVEVAGAGSYAGFKSASYTIEPKTITDDMVTVTPESDVWSGSEQKPEVTVSGLLPGDYAVTYKRGDEVTGDFTDCGEITVTVAPANGNCTGTVSKTYTIEHHPGLECGHAVLMYQETADAEPVYTVDLSYLGKEGIVTLLKPITLDRNVVTQNTRIVMNGHSITMLNYKSISNNSGLLTIDATAGGSIGRDGNDLSNVLIHGGELKIIGSLALGTNSYIDTYSEKSIDLSGYTGDGLLIRMYTSNVSQKPIIPQDYGFFSWTQTNGVGDRLADDTLTGFYKYGKVAKLHAHSWAFRLNESGEAIVATCSGSGVGECSVTGRTVTITLTAPENLTYDGQPKEVTVTQTPAGVFTDIPAVSYEGNRTDAGVHTASLTYGDVTAQKTFTIAPMDITGATVGAFDQMIYDGASQTPKAAVTLANGMTVTGTWSDVTNVSDKTTFTASGNFTGTIADRETGMLRAIPAASDFAFAPPAAAALTYDGGPKTAAVAVKEGVAGMGAVTVQYVDAKGSASETAPVNAGTYKVQISVADGANYAAIDDLTDDSWTFIIQKTDDLNDVTPTGLTAIYGQTLAEVSLAAFPGWEWADASASVGEVNAQGNAHPANYAGDENHNPANGVNLTVVVSQSGSAMTAGLKDDDIEYTYGETVTVLVSGITPTKEAPIAALFSRSAEPANAVAIFNGNTRLTEYVTPGAGGVSFNLTGLDAGAYSLTAYFTGNDNMAKTSAPVPAFTIGKAQPTAIAPAPVTAVYGQTLSEIALTNPEGNTPGTWSWESADASVGNAGRQTHTAAFTPDDEANYTTLTGVEITIEVDRATPGVTAPAAKTLTYTGSAHELIIAGTTTGGTLEYSLDGTNYSTALPAASDAGDYTVYYRVTGNENYYDTAAASIPVSIARATPVVTAPAALNPVYTGSAQVLISAGDTTFGTLEYSLDGETYSTDLPAAAQAGIYTVYYRVPGSSNWNEAAAKTLQAGVGQSSTVMTMTPAAQTVTYGMDAAFTVTARPEAQRSFSLLRLIAPEKNQVAIFHGDRQLTEPQTVTGEALTFTVSTKDAGLNAGQTYTLSAVYVGSSNMKDKTAAADVTVAQAEGSGSVSIAGWTYGTKANDPVPSTQTNDVNAVTYLYEGMTNAGAAYSSASAPTEAGSYTVTAAFAQTTNYMACTTAPASFAIEKTDDLSDVTPAGLTAIYGQTLSSVELPSGWSWDNSTDEVGGKGKNKHKAHFAGDANRHAKDNVELVVTVAQSQSILTADSDKDVYIYGDTVTIEAALAQPRRTFGLLSAFAPAVSGQMAVYNGSTQIGEAKTAAYGQTHTFELAGLTPGGYTLTVRFLESDNMDEAAADVSFTVNWLDLTDVPAPALPDGSTGSGEGQDGDGWYSGDVPLTAPEGYEISTDGGQTWGPAGDVDTADSPDGENTYDYQLKNKETGEIGTGSTTIQTDNTAPVVTPPAVDATDTTAVITAPATDESSGVAGSTLTQTGGEPAVSITDNGGGSFTITGMTPGEPYTFELTVTDHAGNLTTVPVILAASPAPVILSPLEDTDVSVLAGETAVFGVTAENAHRYEWYRSVDGGKTFELTEQTSSSYEAASVTLENDGYQYFCRVYGESGVVYADSPIFTLRVVMLQPETGDHSRIGLWMTMCLISIAGMFAMHGRKRKAE